MTTLKFTTVAAILAASLTNPVQAENGKYLKKTCNARPTGYCLGFVVGAFIDAFPCNKDE